MIWGWADLDSNPSSATRGCVIWGKLLFLLKPELLLL